jgi:NAD(P)-dependent dehydrogenase (short-subunit alcohol dehydrogenase family)
MDFENKNVLVTGGSGGIGRAIARQFAARGARVVVHYHRAGEAARRVAAELPGSGHITLQADLTNPVEVAGLADRAIGKTGGIDILVNNAGLYQEHPAAEVDYSRWCETFERIIRTNLLGPAHLSHRLIQHMKERGGGRIVNVSSRGAFRGEPDAPAYGASKAGLNAMSQSLAKSLGGLGIYVFTVAPGFVDTEMAASHLSGDRRDFIINESPLKRIARPEEVARAVLFLASEGSEFMTGCIVDVNGASYLRT